MKKLILLLIFAFPLFASGQNPNDVAYFDQWNGYYDFKAFGNTLTTEENNGGSACVLLPQSEADLFLGIGENVVAAFLYWGSVGDGDFNVVLNGTAVSADEVFNRANAGLNYFAARADVTNLIAANGSGTYTFSGIDIPQATLNNYCGSTLYGGWAVYVIYENPGGLLTQIKMFDGLERVSSTNTDLTITLDQIEVSSQNLSRIAFLAWEGDAAINTGYVETLELTTAIGTYEPFNAINPIGNNFNSTNTWTGSQVNYQMDLDYYDLATSGIIQPGVTYIDVTLRSTLDLIFVNNIITSVNSELPDATIEIDDLGVLCENNNMDVEYTVYNVNSTNVLDPNTPIAFYYDVINPANLLGQSVTLNEIPIGGSESGTVRLALPIAIPSVFNLIAVVDDDGNGVGIVSETDEDNNEFEFPVDLNQQLFIITPGPACIGTPVILDSGLEAPFTFEWYDAGDPTTVIGTGSTYTVTTDGIYYVEAADGTCRVESNRVTITFRPQPVANAAPDMYQCDFGTTNGTFNLTDQDAFILGAQNPLDYSIDYYETEALAEIGAPGTEILGGVKIIDLPSPETIWARIEDSASGTCYDIISFEIYFSRAIAGIVTATVNYCDANGDGQEIIDLEAEFNPTILDGQPSSDYNITYHLSQADADAGTGALAIPHTVVGPSQQIFIRLENRDIDPNGAPCIDTTQNVIINLDTAPTINTTPPNLIVCDDNNDGFAIFELPLQDDVITLGDPTLTVTYHKTLVTAESNTVELPDFYENDQQYLDIPITDPADPNYGTGGVWARVSNGTSCVSIVPFALEVRFSPVGITPEPLRVCDDATADGIAEFRLTDVAPEVLGTLDPLGFDLYYFEVEAQAIAAGDSALPGPIDISQAIPNPANYLNTNSPYFDEIWILVVSNTIGTIPPNPNSAEGCYDIVRLELYVDPLPADLGPFEIIICDDEVIDGLAIFDLTSVNNDVTNGDPNLSVTWFLNYTNEGLDIPIPDPVNFQNTATPQTVIGRVTSEFGCNTLVELTLSVLANPSPNFNPIPLELCDNGINEDDGIVSGWDLTLADTDIAAGQNVNIRYYVLRDDAEAGLPGTEITMPYTNISNPQIVFARVEFNVPPAVSACFTIVELQLNVLALPDKPIAPFADPFIGCDENGNGLGTFNLTLQNPGVIGNQTASDFAPITYYEDPIVAAAGIPGTEILDPVNYVSAGAGQLIYVRLESLITGCVRITEFELQLELFPTIGVGDDLTECDDLTTTSTDTDGFATFDLTVNTPLIQMGNPFLDVFYYASAIDQVNNIPIPNPGSYRNIVPFQQLIYVTAFSENGCRAINNFFINVEATPDAFSPGVMIACDDDNDGFALFELSSQTDFITGGNINFTVTYHATLLNAQNSIPLVSTLYENDQQYIDTPITDPSIPGYGTGGVWVRIVDETTLNKCPRILSFALEVHAAPIATVPAPLRECDDDPEVGVETFDLTFVEPEVLGTMDPSGYDLYYYEDLAEAQTAGELALTAPDFSQAILVPGEHRNDASPFTQTIYILVVGNANSSMPPNPNGSEGCYDIVELQLIVDPIPANNGPLFMTSCDDELQGSTPIDGISTFDLTENDPIIIGGSLGLTVSWFDSLGAPILDPENYQNVGTPETVVGRVSSNFGCSNDVLVTLTVLPNPEPNDPTPYVLCDDDDDGIMEFDLNTKTLEIQGIENNVSITYYETLQEAIDGFTLTQIPGGIYVNTRSPFNDTVFARVTNDVPPELLPCFTIVELDLEVVALPDSPDSRFEDPILVCDDDNDGTAIFDLTIQDEAVYAGQTQTDFEPITYYTSLGAAEAGINFIDPANAFESVSRTIWVRLESLITGCARITPFEIVVGEFPGSGTANDFVFCDDEESGSTTDGISIFNLKDNDSVITGGDPTLTVIYYASLDDFNNNIPITNPQAYPNDLSQGNPQEIFYTVSGQNSCSDSQSFFITVNPNPQPVEPTALFACDVDSDGFSSFDLESKTIEIQGGDPTLIITYHENLLDANTGNFPLATPYDNIVAFNQTIFVRAAYSNPPSGTGCYAIVTLELIVNPSPVVPQDLPDLIACDDSGFAVFDLTVQEVLILGNPPQTDVTITYHLTEADALAGTAFIVEPENYTNATNPQTIWVRLDDDLTDCFAIGQFNLVVTNGLPITDPTPLEVCDDLGEPNDGFTAINLTVKNSEITNGVLTQGVSYFVTEDDAINNTNRIDDETAYFNISNPQVLYVRVEDSNSSCISFTTLTVRVLNNPTPVTPQAIELCDVTLIIPPGPYDEVEIFDLTIREAQILNGNNWTVGYYKSYNDAVAEFDAIPPLETTAYQNISNPQIIYVRTTNPNTLCFEIVELELIVNPLPDDTAIVSPYIFCSSDGSEIGLFNLDTKIDEILAGQPQPPFDVTFYLNPIDAENQNNRIVGSTTFQNSTNPQTIYTGILNTETGCYIGGVQSFELIVQPGAIAVAPAEPFIICDNLPPSDGFAEFNLEDVTNQQVSDLRAEILAGQDPSIYLITFHETIEQAEAGTGPLLSHM